MPEYVYALHDFVPEHEDEVDFHAGERIEVIEKDDLYGDGWWKGRNLAGKEGLFPQSYTAPASAAESITPSTSMSSGTIQLPPQQNSALDLGLLQPLAEESEVESITPNRTVLEPSPQQPAPFIFLNGKEAADSDSTNTHQRTISSGEEVMKATLTDVQKALEQLGRGDGRAGDERSFSFASSHGENDTDTDYEMSDVDGPEGAAAGESWHKGARTKLAEKARRAVEEAEKLEALMIASGTSSGAGRTTAPPIDVELSDESEGEEDYTTRSSLFPREHPHIPEEDEEDLDTDQASSRRRSLLQHVKDPSSGRDTVKRVSTGINDLGGGGELFVPEQDTYDAQTATATRTFFPVTAQEIPIPQPPQPALESSPPKLSPPQQDKDIESTAGTATPQPDPEPLPQPVVILPQPHTRQPAATSNPVYRESLIALPSPTGSFPGTSSPKGESRHNSMASAASSSRPSGGSSGLSQPPLSAQNTLVEEQHHIPQKKDKTAHPMEWSVEEVVDWLKSKGFDQDVCEKFTEQEITGDVLLELDVTLLKTEIGIMAFGKRMRIANAITDLRRPPSVVYSDHHAQQLQQLQQQQHSPSLVPNSPLSATTHSRHVSLSQSQHSFPGTAHPYASQSPGPGQIVYAQLGPGVQYASTSMMGESPGMEYLSPPTMSPEMETMGIGSSISAPAMNGNGKVSKGRPAHLLLSPSDGALKESAMAIAEGNPQAEPEEDRGVASESEAVPTNHSVRRRLFGRSQDSSSSKLNSPVPSRHSRDGSTISPTYTEKSSKEKDKDKDSLGTRNHGRSKKSLDGKGGGSERLSIFGGTFSSALVGKGRKPPPKFAPSSEDGSQTIEKSSMFTLPRLHGTSGGSRKVSAATVTSDRPATAIYADDTRPLNDTSALPVNVVKETRDPALLRKRTSSAPAPPTSSKNGNASGVMSPLKQGQSILGQIGEPDHKGWMRKRSERYNTWKLRYFVLKGPHLYCLRSNSENEKKIKGYVNIVGYKVTVDENVNPGKYGFRIEHDNDKTHYFSSDEKAIIRGWMKAIMKATIARDYTKPVISSVNIPTIPLTVAQAMNPAPRPPSPTARDATQRAMRRDNPNQLSSRDARILMGLPSGGESDERTRLESFFANETVAPNGGSSSFVVPPQSPAPVRPSREMRRFGATRTPAVTPEEAGVVEWANTHLPLSLQIRDASGSICGGLELFRIAESIKGRPVSPPVSDALFPQGPNDDKLDGLFKLFDFLLDNDVKMGSVSINDVRQGNRDKILQLLRALKAWEDKRRALASTIGGGAIQSGGFVAAVPVTWS